MSKPDNTTVYELWSRDTFEGRTYLCETFYSYSEANAALERYRKEALSQDEGLRDSYWLVRTTVAEAAERKAREAWRYIACKQEESYDKERLRTICGKAADKFYDYLRSNGDGPELNRDIETEWSHPGDCFNSVWFHVGRSDEYDIYYVVMGVGIRSSEHYAGGGVSTFVLREGSIDNLCRQLRSEEIRQNLFSVACDLIKSHFDDDRP